MPASPLAGDAEPTAGALLAEARRARVLRELIECAHNLDWDDGRCPRLEELTKSLTAWHGVRLLWPPNPPPGETRDAALRSWAQLFDRATDASSSARLETDLDRTAWGLGDGRAVEVAYVWVPARRRDAGILLVWKDAHADPVEKEEVVRDLRIVGAQFGGRYASRRLPPLPPVRRLRTYAFDPSLSLLSDTAAVNEVTLTLAWETDRQPESPPGMHGEVDYLLPGPVGEYVEVIDVDPASGCSYDPVDLNDPRLLASNGLEPTEGDPRFHQQMVYAVAMTTIRNFERALGRRVLWSPRLQYNPDGEVVGEESVRRLRIYPHALREPNAYYSQHKKALLFGYFDAISAVPGLHLPHGIVFTCLSHDVIAHETAHALLDGMHRRFIEPSNPDALAFHEAFADLTALFQHFSFPEVLRHQIAHTRGDLASQSLLGQLAQQFGRATGRRRALRDALGEDDSQTGQWTARVPDPTWLDRIKEPHARGAALLAAVFGAFLTIYRTRVADLFRISTGGTGHLPAGALPPDLVNRLAGEAAKAARHVLTMCIRALDYCPPVDLTFGDFLRALITADTDLVPADPRHYRAAVIEAFRAWGIHPTGIRTLSAEGLCWRAPSRTDQETVLFSGVTQVLRVGDSWDLSRPRHEIYDAMRTNQRALSRWIDEHGRTPAGNALLALVGLNPALGPIEVHSVRPTRRVGPGGQTLIDVVVEMTQRRPGYISTAPGQATGPPDFYFRGGCTLLVDPASHKIRYCIVKHVDDEARYGRQRDYLADLTSGSLSTTYFGHRAACAGYFGLPGQGRAEPFAMLHRPTEG